MKTESFAYWLKGFVELTDGVMPTVAQWEMIKEHLDLAFNKQTSGFGQVSGERPFSGHPKPVIPPYYPGIDLPKPFETIC